MTVIEDLLENTAWASKQPTSNMIDVESFLKYGDGRFTLLEHGICEQFENHSILSIPSFLVGLAVNIYRFDKEISELPTSDEIDHKLKTIRDAMVNLASLAKGEKSRTNPYEGGESRHGTARSTKYDEDGVKDNRDHAADPDVLHPALEAYIFASSAHELGLHEEGVDRDALDEAMSCRRSEIIHFFEMLEPMAERMEDARALCRVVSRIGRSERRRGAPGDQAKDQLFVRLMWVWRDVFGQELTIYMPRIAKGSEDPTLRADSCMRFVADVMASVEPIREHELSALEKKLSALRSEVPDTPLAM